MNERIKELALLAGYKPLSPSTLADELNEIFMQKFAELIVEECASMARVYCAHEFDFTGDLELDEFMLKHFGVEE